MAEEEALRSSEESALDNSQIVSSVTGNKGGSGKSKGKSKFKKGFSAAIFITFMIIIFLGIFSAGNLLPTWIAERLIEVTDVQYADAVETKALVFQHALEDKSMEVPNNTAELLRERGVLIGDEKNGTFVEDPNGSSVQYDGKIIRASSFSSELKKNLGLYDAFTSATYSRAAYYYDDDAKAAFEQMGISRDNFYGDESFEEVMEKIMGEGSNITVTNGETEKFIEKKESETDNTENATNDTDKDNEETPTDNDNAEDTSEDQDNDDTDNSTDDATDDATDDGERNDDCRDTNEGRECDKTKAEIKLRTATEFVSDVGRQNKASSSGEATINAADTLAVADSITQEQRSARFYSAIMENISKMKAGYGNEAKLNEAMNFLYTEATTEVVDVETGELVKKTGTMLESPSLYAILSGDKLNVEKVSNYSAERILKTLENKSSDFADFGTLSSTIAAANDKKGKIGRWMTGTAGADIDDLSVVTPTISSSLVDNSFKTIKGIDGGELLVQGAVNVSSTLALRSGATVGDSDSVEKYAKLTQTILALDAEVDRMKRSPLDITSKNTFLGSIMYKFAVSTTKSGSLINKIASFSRVTASSMMSLFPIVNADDEKVSYLTEVGDCPHLDNIWAVGTATCARNETFDTSTYNWIFEDKEAIKVLEKNIEKGEDENTWKIKPNSDFEKFAKYNVERMTPVGVMDGKILQELSGENPDDEFFSLKSLWNKFIRLFGSFSSSNENDEMIASGEMYVNSDFNDEWYTTYKYAQRYFSIVRAVNNLRQYDGDQTAYGNIPYIGIGNPVLACYERIHKEAIAANE